MTRKIIFLDHHENPMDDIAWTHLGALGLERQLVRPVFGDQLPTFSDDIAGVVIYGGGQNCGEQDQFPFLRDELKWLEASLKQDIPILGICLGGQLLANVLGARVGPRKPRECEFGYYEIEATDAAQDWMPPSMYVTEAHYEEFDLPAGAERLAGSARFGNQAFRYGDKVYGLQFHPEVTADIFTRWQFMEWSDEMLATHGAQTREQQDALKWQYDQIQGDWFRQKLEQLFVPESQS